MNVTCSNCESQYELDPTEINWDGVAVRCTNCGYLFRIKKPVEADDAFVASDTKPGVGFQIQPDTTWLIRLEDGEIKPCRQLKSLQMWIIAGRVTPRCEISKTGKDWKCLGELEFLVPFFELAEKAQKFSERDLPHVEQAADGSVIVHVDQVSGRPQQNQPEEDLSRTRNFQSTPTPEPVPFTKTPGEGLYITAKTDDNGDPSFRIGWLIALFAIATMCIAGIAIIWLLNKNPQPTSSSNVDVTTLDDESKIEDGPVVVPLKDAENLNPNVGVQDDWFETIARSRWFTSILKQDEFVLDNAIEELSRSQNSDSKDVLLAIMHAEKSIRLQDKLKIGLALTHQEKNALKDNIYLSRKHSAQAINDGKAGAKWAECYSDLVNSSRTEVIYRKLVEAQDSGVGKEEVDYIRGLILARDNRLVEASPIFSNLADNASDYRIHYKNAMAYFQQGSLQAASEALDSVLNDMPNHVSAIWLLSLIQKSRNQESLNSDVIQQANNNQIQEAESLVASKMYAEAIDAYEKILKETPQHPAALTGIGIVHSEKGDYVVAHQFFNRALASSNRFQDAYFAIADTYHKQRLTLKAEDAYKNILRLFPDSPKSKVATEYLNQLNR